jgi:hypothetical protein
MSGSFTQSMDGVTTDPGGSASYTDVSVCDDYIGRPVVDSGFNSTQYERSLMLDGKAVGKPWAGNKPWIQFQRYPVLPSTGGVSTVGMGMPSGWELTATARTNPSRPELTPLTLLQDLKELPRMLRDIPPLINTPKTLLSAKELANKHLAVQFGWIPFVKDMLQLLDLQAAVNKRSHELSRLYSGAGSRKRVSFGEVNRNGTVTRTNSIGFGSSFKYTQDVKFSSKCWATVRWKPVNRPFFSPTTSALNSQARRLVLGLTPEGLAKGAWDVIPWTWLLGWFTNVGDYALATSNSVPATRTSTCLMIENQLTISAGSIVPTGADSFEIVHSGVYKETTKARYVGGLLTPGFNIPFIGLSKLSVLNSLAIQRFKG